MFRPKPSLKSFVKDNDIHFFTDQVIEKFGEQSHAIITYMYTYMVEHGICGNKAWDVCYAWELVNSAKENVDHGR